MATTITLTSPFTMSNHVARRSSDSEESPSSFTPVNGRAEQTHTNGQHEDTSPSDVSPNGEPYTGPSSANNSPTNSPHLRLKNERAALNGANGGKDLSSSPLPHESVEQAHKRKRSSSTETNGNSAHARYDYSPPKRAEHQHMAEGALQALGDTDRHAHPPHDAQTNGSQPGHHSHSTSWQSNPGQYSQQQNGGPMNLSEAHLATALQQHTQREAGTPQNQRATRDTSSADGYGQDQTGSGQSGNKRKRMFSNRTKTGCKTCRQRKKKCDEGQPTCQNCARGGFPCQGYSNSTFSRPPIGKGPVPLQSKDGEYSHIDPNGYHANTSPPGSKRSSLPSEMSQSRVMTIEDGDGHGQYTASPQSAEPRVRNAYPGQPWSQAGPYSGQPSHGPGDRLPSFSAFSKVESQKQDYGHPQQQYRSQPPTNMSQQQQPPPPPQAASQWHAAPPPPPPPQQQQDYRQQYPAQIETSHPPQPSHHHRMSSTYDPVKQPQSGNKPFFNENIEKSKMQRGQNFDYFDPTLTNERQRCVAALKRYNAASEISSGLSDDDKLKLLEKVIDPSQDTTHKFLVPCLEKGLLGPNVKIEAPFTAAYGYNLQIHDEVCIHHHCNIDDAAVVKIGPRAWIGPDVKIITTDYRNQMQDRKGVTGQWHALSVEIGQEAYIGNNVTIYPGVKIGRGATVCHGAIVTESIEDNVRLKANGQKDYQ